MTNPFTNPAEPGSGEPAPRPRDLLGCLVAYAPRSITLAGEPGNDKGVGKSGPRDRVTADLIVLDVPQAVRDPQFQTTPGVIAYGGSPDWEQDPKPHYLQVTGPAKFDGVWVSQENIVKYALAPGRTPLVGQLILGRIERSTFGNKPFNLVKVDGTPDMEKAIQIYTALAAGALAYNTPQPIPGAPVPQKAPAPAGAPMPPANSVNYGYAPSPVPPQPTAWTTPPTIPPALVPGVDPSAVGFPAPPTAPTMDFAAFQAQQQAAAAQAALAAAGMQPVPVAPPAQANGHLEPALQAQGWTVETWAQLSPDQKSQVRVAAGLPPF